jgi:hypothetical protein
MVKYNFLIEEKDMESVKILYSVRDYRDRYTLILKYIDDNKIKSVNEEDDFTPWEVKDGLHLVKIKEDLWELHEVVNTGIIRDYWVNCCVGKVSIQEVDVKDKVDDSDVLTNTLKELVIKIKKK